MQSIFEAQPDKHDPYKVLGCVESSTNEQIKTEYKRLALIHHPDKSCKQDDKTAYEKIKAAYDVVGDPAKRASYDRWRRSGLQIPFADYARLGTHAQTVHWQSLPTQLALTEEDNIVTESNPQSLPTRQTLPQSDDKLPPVVVNQTSFWTKNNDTYAKFRDYRI